MASMGSVTLNVTDSTTAAIVAGRRYCLERTIGDWKRLCADVDALGEKLGVSLAIVVGTHLGAFGDGDEVIANATVGILVAATDAPEPRQVDTELLQGALTQARALPWADIDTALGPDIDDPREDVPTHVYLAATGPQAGAHLAFGVPARDESELSEWSAGSPQSRLPDLEWVAGKDMNQHWIEDGVWGVKIAYVGDWECAVVDEALEAYERNRARLGALATDACHWLMACYD